jgi:hypothetical protein
LKNKVKPAEILHRLNFHYGEETLPCACDCDWYRKFCEGHIHPTAVRDVNIHHVKELIFQSRQIKVRDVASSSGISVGRDDKSYP